MGYARAGFEVYGADLKRYKRYPFSCREVDCLTMSPEEIARDFDAVHASPNCQGYSAMRHAKGALGRDRTIPQFIDLLEATGLPYILENVEEARCDMPGAICLCGTMFGLGYDGHELRRHRLFTSNRLLMTPGPCRHSGGAVIGVYGGHARCRAALAGGRGTKDVWRGGHSAAASAALGIDWMSLAELSEAIPPAYTEHLGAQLMAQL